MSCKDKEYIVYEPTLQVLHPYVPIYFDHKGVNYLVISSDGGLEFSAAVTPSIPGEQGCPSSPHSKTVKRLITNHTGPHGRLYTDGFQCAYCSIFQTETPEGTPNW